MVIVNESHKLMPHIIRWIQLQGLPGNEDVKANHSGLIQLLVFLNWLLARNTEIMYRVVALPTHHTPIQRNSQSRDLQSEMPQGTYSQIVIGRFGFMILELIIINLRFVANCVMKCLHRVVLREGDILVLLREVHRTASRAMTDIDGELKRRMWRWENALILTVGWKVIGANEWAWVAAETAAEWHQTNAVKTAV